MQERAQRHCLVLIAAFTLASLSAFSLTPAFGAGSSYYPPPEKKGGWRTLVRPNQPATEAEKKAILEKTGLDWDKLQTAWQYIEELKVPNSFLVIRHGWVAGEWSNLSGPKGIASSTKSMTSLAMARLFDLSDAGKLARPITIDDPAYRFLPPAWGQAEPARKQIRLRHLLTMTSGLTPYDGPYKEDYLQQLFAQKVEAPPGTVWAYASVPVDMLSLVIENATGRRIGDFFNEEIGARVGAAPVKWGKFSGHDGGSGGPEGGARFPARELARIGYLVLHNGAWETNGRREQVLSAARLREFTRHAPWLESATYREPNFAREKNAQACYGYLWWTNQTGALCPDAPRDIVYTSGWGKQACWVSPSLDMVVVRLGPHKKLNEIPEFYSEFWKRIMAAVRDRPQ